MSAASPKSSALVIGESLTDVVRTADGKEVEIVGGSPANVALGLGRLGDAPTLLTALGDDEEGRRIAEHLTASGATIDPESWSLDHTSRAIANIRPNGSAEYEFDVEWALPAAIRLRAARVVHTGSIAAFLSPGAERITAFLQKTRTAAIVTFDPNIRPALVGSHEQALARVLEVAALSDVVKLSDEDAAWLWPGSSANEVIELLLRSGAALVAMTLGGEGAIAATAGHRIRVAAPEVAVADTVGAGDTFMAALIHKLLERPELCNRPDEQVLTDAVTYAVVAASITVGRAGADLPTADDVLRALR